MDERATGIVLRVRLLTETSLVVHWLTEEAGRIATVARGARRPKSPFRGKLDLFFLARIAFQRSSRSELHSLREMELRDTHAAVRTSLEYLNQASYAGALIEQVTEPETPVPELFALLKGFLASFPAREPGALPVFAFEMKLLNEIGLCPPLAEVKLSEGSRKVLEKCLEMDWKELTALQLSNQQTDEIKRFLQGFMQYHLGRVPAGRSEAAG